MKKVRHFIKLLMKRYLYYYKSTLLIGINTDKEGELTLLVFLIIFYFWQMLFFNNMSGN
jgi:hypothetical protein